jgi:hypothetical protein
MSLTIPAVSKIIEDGHVNSFKAFVDCGLAIKALQAPFLVLPDANVEKRIEMIDYVIKDYGARNNMDKLFLRFAIRHSNEVLVEHLLKSVVPFMEDKEKLKEPTWKNLKLFIDLYNKRKFDECVKLLSEDPNLTCYYSGAKIEGCIYWKFGETGPTIVSDYVLENCEVWTPGDTDVWEVFFRCGQEDLKKKLFRKRLLCMKLSILRGKCDEKSPLKKLFGSALFDVSLLKLMFDLATPYEIVWSLNLH